MDLTLSASGIEINPESRSEVKVDIKDVSVSEILDQIQIDDVLNHYGAKKFLSLIDVEDAANHYGLSIDQD